jgi:hypothetical protein
MMVVEGWTTKRRSKFRRAWRDGFRRGRMTAGDFGLSSKAISNSIEPMIKAGPEAFNRIRRIFDRPSAPAANF